MARNNFRRHGKRPRTRSEEDAIIIEHTDARAAAWEIARWLGKPDKYVWSARDRLRNREMVLNPPRAMYKPVTVEVAISAEDQRRADEAGEDIRVRIRRGLARVRDE